MNRKPRTIAHRRKREQRTSYHKRIRTLMSRSPRFVVRLTNQKIIVQLITFAPQGDQCVVGIDSFRLKKLGWTSSCKNIPAAYATGFLLARDAVKKGVAEAVLDTGFRAGHKTGRIYAVLQGALDGGLKIPHGDNIFPTPERLQGKHLKSAASATIITLLAKIKQDTKQNNIKSK